MVTEASESITYPWLSAVPTTKAPDFFVEAGLTMPEVMAKLIRLWIGAPLGRAFVIVIVLEV